MTSHQPISTSQALAKGEPRRRDFIGAPQRLRFAGPQKTARVSDVDLGAGKMLGSKHNGIIKGTRYPNFPNQILCANVAATSETRRVHGSWAVQRGLLCGGGVASSKQLPGREQLSGNEAGSKRGRSSRRNGFEASSFWCWS